MRQMRIESYESYLRCSRGATKRWITSYRGLPSGECFFRNPAVFSLLGAGDSQLAARIGRFVSERWMWVWRRGLRLASSSRGGAMGGAGFAGSMGVPMARAPEMAEGRALLKEATAPLSAAQLTTYFWSRTPDGVVHRVVDRVRRMVPLLSMT